MSSPFDGMAADYDAVFTHSRIGRLLRQAMLPRLDAHFGPGDCVLELNCGTGEDAVHLARRGVRVLATDGSAAMAQAARDKVANFGLANRVEVRQMAIEEIVGVRGWGSGDGDIPTPSSPPPASAFDGALSNFGGLNCVEDVRGVAEGLAACLRPGAVALLCVMGPLCLWEWGWYLRKGQPKKAFRRLRRGGVLWRGLTIRYPSIRAVRHAFGQDFRLRRASAVGALLPPTYAEGWAARHEKVLAHLNAWERRLETLPPLPSLADHYLLELERV
jgi:SAM-dependent methyltransferase